MAKMNMWCQTVQSLSLFSLQQEGHKGITKGLYKLFFFSEEMKEEMKEE